MSSVGTPPMPPSRIEPDDEGDNETGKAARGPDGCDDDEIDVDDGDPNGPFETSEKSHLSEPTSDTCVHATEPDADDKPNTQSVATRTCDDTVVVNEDETHFPEFLYAREDDQTSKGSLDDDPDSAQQQRDYNHNSNLPVGIQLIEEPTSVEVGCQTDPERDSIMKRFMSALPWVQTREPDFAVVSISNPFDDFRAPAVPNGARTKQQKTVITTTKYETRDCCRCTIL